MNKVVHCKKEPFDIYIGRPSIFGNPFSHKKGTQAQVVVGTRQEAIEKYHQWIKGQIKVPGLTPPTVEQILELKDKILGCWCSPQACHGDVLVNVIRKKVENNE